MMRVVLKAKLKLILSAHLKWLKNSNTGSRADLSWADLSWANLSGAYLSWANLSGANLSGAYLLHCMTFPLNCLVKGIRISASLKLEAQKIIDSWIVTDEAVKQ